MPILAQGPAPRTAPQPHQVWDAADIVGVFANAQANNNSQTLYTVPTGRTLYLTSVYMSMESSAAGAIGPYLIVQDASAVQVSGWVLFVQAAGHDCFALGLSVPHKIPAGYKFVLVSSAITVFVVATITGYTLPE